MLVFSCSVNDSMSSFYRGKIVKRDKGLLVPEGSPPELCSICFGDAEVVTLKETVGEDGLQLSQHVAEDQ